MSLHMRNGYGNRMNLAPDAGDGAGSGGGGDSGGSATPPAKFNFGGKLVTFAEAQAMLKEADDLKAQYAEKGEYVSKLEAAVKGAKQYKDNVQAWLRTGDVNAAEQVMRTHGFNDQQIELAKKSITNSGGRRAEADDDDDADDSDITTPTRRNDAVSAEVTALKQQISELVGTVQKMQAGQERWNQWGKNRWSQDAKTELEQALANDEIVGKQFKTKKNQALAERIRKLAVEDAMKQAEASGGLNQKIVQQAVATARGWVQDAGWLDDTGTNSAVPGVGDPFGGVVGFGEEIKIQPGYKPKNDPTVENGRDDFAHTLALAGQQSGPDPSM